MLINKDFGNIEVDPKDLQKIDLDEETIAQYQKVFQKNTGFWERFGNFLTAENKAGRYAKAIKDFALIFVPYGRTISTATQMAKEIIDDNDMKQSNNFADKIKKVRNWFSYNDKDGNFSFKELGISLLKIGIPTAIAYGLTYYDLWDKVVQIMSVIS